jgi:hypothetical protein
VRLLLVLGALVCLVLGFVAGLAGAHPRPGNWWTETQAESIGLIRGTPVRVRRCEGLGDPRGQAGRSHRFRHLRCLAATGLGSVAPIDRVAVTYVLHPLGKYTGRRSPHTETNVRFAGFGVP